VFTHGTLEAIFRQTLSRAAQEFRRGNPGLTPADSAQKGASAQCVKVVLVERQAAWRGAR